MLGVSVVPFAGGIFFVAGNAFVFAMLAALIIFAFSMMRGVTAETMVLLGIALVFLFKALLALLQYIASEQALQQVVFWSLGSLAKANWPKLGLTTRWSVVVTVPFFCARAWQLTALRLGDERARALGVDVQRLRLMRAGRRLAAGRDGRRVRRHHRLRRAGRAARRADAGGRGAALLPAGLGDLPARSCWRPPRS